MLLKYTKILNIHKLILYVKNYNLIKNIIKKYKIKFIQNTN